MTRPHLINDHRYTTGYAGIDPEKTFCEYEHVEGVACGKQKADHIPMPTAHAE